MISIYYTDGTHDDLPGATADEEEAILGWFRTAPAPVHTLTMNLQDGMQVTAIHQHITRMVRKRRAS